jgi:hypothetical protein
LVGKKTRGKKNQPSTQSLFLSIHLLEETLFFADQLSSSACSVQSMENQKEGKKERRREEKEKKIEPA